MFFLLFFSAFLLINPMFLLIFFCWLFFLLLSRFSLILVLNTFFVSLLFKFLIKLLNPILMSITFLLSLSIPLLTLLIHVAITSTTSAVSTSISLRCGGCGLPAIPSTTSLSFSSSKVSPSPIITILSPALILAPLSFPLALLVLLASTLFLVFRFLIFSFLGFFYPSLITFNLPLLLPLNFFPRLVEYTSIPYNEIKIIIQFCLDNLNLLWESINKITPDFLSINRG